MILFACPVSSTQPPDRQVAPVSMTVVWEMILFASLHISVFRVWPGRTGLENLTLTALSWVGSLLAKCWRICLTEIPREQSPCSIGVENPPKAANSGEMWRGLRSPDIL